MRRHIGRTLAATVAAAGAAVLTVGLAVPAGAAPARPAAGAAVTATSGTAGYVTGGGRHFRYVETTVKVSPVRNASQYAEVVLGGAGVSPVTLAVKAGGGASSVGWAVGTTPFHMAGGAMANLSPAVGDMLRLSIYYDQRGHVYFTAVDTTKGGSQTVKADVWSGTMYTGAQAAVVESGYTASVATDFQLWAFSGSKVTTYTGIKGTMLGPWTTSTIVATYKGAVVMSPNGLWNAGANFGVWRR